MVSIWISCGFEVNTTGSNVNTMWFSNGHHVVSMWTWQGFRVDTTSLLWFPHDFHRWKCHFHGEIPQDGNNIISTSFLWVETMSFPGGNHMVSMFWLNCGLKLAWKLQISWFPCCLCHFHGFLYGHHVSSKPHGNQHKKQLCMKPTGFLVVAYFTVCLLILLIPVPNCEISLAIGTFWWLGPVYIQCLFRLISQLIPIAHMSNKCHLYWFDWFQSFFYWKFMYFVLTLKFPVLVQFFVLFW